MLDHYFFFFCKIAIKVYQLRHEICSLTFPITIEDNDKLIRLYLPAKNSRALGERDFGGALAAASHSWAVGQHLS